VGRTDSLLAPCGLVCTECEAYQATQADDAAAVARVAAEWTERYRIPFSPDDIWCDGCASTSERTSRHCGPCPVRACARQRGFATCAACPDYPCDPLARIHRLAPEARERLERDRDGRG
jgi:hypothetical protein